MSTDFVFPLNGWAQGRKTFRLRAGKAFFDSYENPEILDADLSVAVSIEKTDGSFDVDCDIEGSVTVPCDRCLEDLVVGVDEHPRFRVRFDALPEREEGTGDSREPLLSDAGDKELDLSQVVYDYVCLAVPLHKVHPEGECNPDTVRFLSTASEEEMPAGDTPFTALRDLFKDSGK